MTPEEKQMLNELYQRMQERKVQQLALPVDDASRNALGAAISTGTGSSAKTQVIDTSGASAIVPAAYVQTFILVVNGVQYEVPSLI